MSLAHSIMGFLTNIFRSIQSKLVFYFALASLFAVVLLIVFGQLARDITLRAANDDLLIKARNTADTLDAFNQHNLQTFSVVAQLPDIVSTMELVQRGETLTDAEHENVHAILDTLRTRPWSQNYVLSYAMLDLDGINIVDTNEVNEGRSEANEDYFVQALRTGTVTMTTVRFEQNTGGVFFYISVPIRGSDQPGPIIGVLRARLALSTVQTLLVDQIQQPTDTLIVLDQNRVRIADTRYDDLLFRAIAPFDALQLAELQASEQLPPLNLESVTRAVGDMSEAIDTMDLVTDTSYTGHIHPTDPTRWQVVIVPMESQPWLVAYARPAPIFFAPIHRLNNGILLLSIVLFGGALLTAVILARSISRPIRNLTAIADEVSKGRLDIKADVLSQDEVGILARTFNQMTTQLRHINNTLEERVAERTAELTEVNASLKKAIAERKRLEEETIRLAVESERAQILAGFVQDVSHEFKMPLSVINVQSHIIGQLGGDEMIPRIEAIQNQSRNIEALVNDMVILTRMDSDSFALASGAIWLREFVRSVVMNQTALAQARGITLTFAAPDEDTDSQVVGDGKLLHTALQQIIENAILFSPADTQVMVSIEYRSADTAAIVIADQGMGIAPEHVGKVFDRFFRVDEARTERGFGLGLPIAQKIVDKHGGMIMIESVLGKGTTVTVELQLVVS